VAEGAEETGQKRRVGDWRWGVWGASKTRSLTNETAKAVAWRW